MNVEHQCSWTLRKQTELHNQGSSVLGAGGANVVLLRAASLLGTSLTIRPSEHDPYGEEVVLEGISAGGTHDECFYQLEPSTSQLIRALLQAELERHGRYLDRDIDWSDVFPELNRRLTAGTTLRLRSLPGKHRLAAKMYRRENGFFSRMLARTLWIDCSSGVAALMR